MKKFQHTLSRYTYRICVWGVLGFVFLTALHKHNNFPKVSKENTIAVSIPPAQVISHSSAGTVRLNDSGTDGPIHILLIGQDRTDPEPRSRSDCMILCTFRRDKSTLTMTSFLRDLYVKIPGYAGNRLNAAYAFGGMPLIRQTFQENFDITIDGCMEVDFGQFSQLIDLLGGITIELRADEATCINSEMPGSILTSGVQHLNGPQALCYCRIRCLDEDGDFSRTQRQQKVLTALLKGCQSATVSDLIRLYREAAPMLSTDMGKGQLLSLIRTIAPMMSQMKVTGQRIPTEGTYSHRFIDGMAVLEADLNAARNVLQDTLKRN